MKTARKIIVSFFAILLVFTASTFLPLPTSLKNSLSLPHSFAIGPTTVSTSTSISAIQAFGTPNQICYSSGYYFVFFYDGANVVWASSQTGASWTGTTTILTSYSNGYAIYCDASGNIYLTYSLGTTTFAYRQGTTSAGAITWSFAAITLTCGHGGDFCGGDSVYAFDTSHVWIGVIAQDGSANGYNEIWACNTSACSTTGNWASKDAFTPSGSCVPENVILGLSSNANVALIYSFCGSNLDKIITTSNTGTSWSSAVATSNSYQLAGAFVSIGSTVYGAQLSSSKIYFIQFTQGGGSWTETSIDSTNVGTTLHPTLATDGSTNFVTVYQDSTSGQLDYQSSTNTGSTWSGKTTYVTSEATFRSGLQSTPTLQSTLAGVIWEAGASSPYSIRFATSPALTITETLTGKLLSGGQTEKATLSGAAACTPTSMNFSTAGSTNTLTCNPSSALTVTVATGNSTARWWGNSTWTSHTSYTFTTGSSSESHTLYNYFQLNKSYTATPTSPSLWDANYNIKVNATFLGVASTTIATLSAVSASGITVAKANFSDYNSAQIFPASFVSSVTGKWINASASQFKDTVASAVTHNVNYQRDYLNNFLYTLLYGGAIGTITMSCPVISISTNYVLTTSSQSLPCDPGSTASVTGTISGGSGERFIANTSSYVLSSGSGGSTFNFVYVHQYELNMTISGPGVTSPVGSNFYNSGNVVAITAFPNAGAAFSSWTGTGTGSFTGTSASATVTISASISELATFNSVGSVSVSLTLNLINAGKIVNSTNYFSINYFSGGVSTNIHFVGTSPLTFTADGNRKINITSPSQLSGSKNRWCLSTGCSLFQTPNSPLSGTWILAYSYFEQDNISAFFTAPISCGGCSTQPSLSYIQFGNHVSSTLAQSAATFWVDNGTSWQTTIPFFWDLSYWVPSPSGGTFQKAQVLDITYTQTPSSNLAVNCGSATDPFIQFSHMCWVPGFIDSYGNLIGVGNFITILWCVFAVAVWLKSGNPLLTTIVLLLGFATFSAVSAGIAGTSLSFITSIGWQIGLIAFILVSAGTVIRLFVGRNS